MSAFTRYSKELVCPHPDDNSGEILPDYSCPGCGDLYPWLEASKSKFFSVGNGKSAVFVRQLDRGQWKQAASFCPICAIVYRAMQFQPDKSKDKDSDLIKVRINSRPGATGLIIGPQFRKDDRIEVFVPSGLSSRIVTDTLLRITDVCTT